MKKFELTTEFITNMFEKNYLELKRWLNLET